MTHARTSVVAALAPDVEGWRRYAAWSLPVSMALFGAALLLLFMGHRDLPMVDLPQHAAQIATWWHWDHPDYRAGEYLELNLRTPYLLAYGLARLLAPLLGVVVALKLVIWLAVIATMVAFTTLARKLGHDPWLGLLGLPIAFGYSFYFGFVSFVSATPLTIFCCVAALKHRHTPGVRSGVLLSALLCLTLVCHGVAFAIAGATAGVLLLRGGGAFWARLLPCAPSLAFAAIWLPPGASMARMGRDVWEVDGFRGLSLPAAIVGMDAADPVALALGSVLLVLCLAACGKLARQPERWILLLVAVGGYCLFPASLRGYGFMPGRFAAFVLPGILLACSPRAAHALSGPASAWLRSAMLVFVSGWLLLFGVRLAAFNDETASFHRLVDALPRGLRVRSIIYERAGKAFPGMPLHLHLPAYYQAEKGGFLGHSFAIYPNSVLRLQKGIPPAIPLAGEWYPELFDAAVEGPRFDYVIVRSRAERAYELFASAKLPVRLDAHWGDWWGYRIGG